MHIILLCGGAGKRLWPLSGVNRSKLFLRLLPDGQGGRCSMLQRIWRQLQRTGLADFACLAVVRDQETLLRRQLGDGLPVIVEPERRDTFPSVALSAAYLHSVRGAGKEDVVCVMPADTYTEDAFFRHVRHLEKALTDTGAELALIGVKPSFPSGEYGYLVPAAGSGNTGSADEPKLAAVQSFVEKPDETKAKQLIGQHALWNCGVFAFRLGLMLEWLDKHHLPRDYAELSQRFSELPNISFDYEVAERSESMVALVYDGMWKDLGNWQSLTGEMDRAVIGQGVVSEDARNVHVINELDIPVYVIGLSDVIVAITGEGMLVADKRMSGKIKEMI